MPDFDMTNLPYSKDDFAIIMHTYNNADKIQSILKNALKYANHVIIVDDNSTDHTCETMHNLPVTILQNFQRRGKNACLLRGLSYSNNFKLKGIVTIDINDNAALDNIPKLIQAMQTHPNHIIIGNQQVNNKKNERPFKLADFFISLIAGQKIIGSQSSFRLYPANLLQQTLPLLKYSRKSRTLESEILIDAARHGVRTTVLQLYANHETAKVKEISVIDTGKIISMIGWKILSHRAQNFRKKKSKKPD